MYTHHVKSVIFQIHPLIQTEASPTHGKIIDRGSLCDRLFKTQKFANHMGRQPHSSGSCQLCGGAASISQNISPFSFSVLGDKGQIYSHGDGCNFFSSVGSSRNCTTQQHPYYHYLSFELALRVKTVKIFLNTAACLFISR